MAILLELLDSRDAARMVDALHAQAEAEAIARPMLARRYQEIANRIADALDHSGTGPQHAPSSDPLDPAYDRQPLLTRRT